MNGLIVDKKKLDKLIVLFEDKPECCGCTACCSICPKEAIGMKVDKEGFSYPEIDVNKCIQCQLCLKVCPIKKN